jgi:hypothetical protein
LNSGAATGHAAAYYQDVALNYFGNWLCHFLISLPYFLIEDE